MNIFASYVRPSNESDEGSLTSQDDFQGFEEMNGGEFGEQGLPVDQDPVIQDASGEDKAIEAFGGAVKEIDDCKASLEGAYNILAGIYNEGRQTLTDSEHSFLSLVNRQCASRLGARPEQLIASVESDNYFQSHDVVASMEGLGSAIKAGAKAAWETIKKLIAKVKDFFGKLFSAIGMKAKQMRNFVTTIVKNKYYFVSCTKIKGAKNPIEAVDTVYKQIKDFNSLVPKLASGITDISPNNQAVAILTDKKLGNLTESREGDGDSVFTSPRTGGAQIVTIAKRIADMQEDASKVRILDLLNTAEKSLQKTLSQADLGEENGNTDATEFSNFIQELRTSYGSLLRIAGSFQIEEVVSDKDKNVTFENRNYGNI